MKKFLPLLLVFLLMAGFAPKASAQFSIGPRVGLNVNELKFDAATFDSENRVGYCAGLEAEFMFPAVNVGFDLSVMYTRRGSNLPWQKPETDMETQYEKSDNDYIEVPLNLKWKIGIPGIGNIVTPYVFTGPSFSFLAKKKSIQTAWGNFKNKNLDMAWNFGFGVQLFKKLQVGASYGLGMSQVLEKVDDTIGSNLAGDGPAEKIYDSKNRCWTITAAWMF